ncbi:MAG TPA: peptidylprolyl isomerase [Bryobacteraceae bacterium]|nr:peptidylprolyl isomerase [Bryobacteraceae bacterium]
MRFWVVCMCVTAAIASAADVTTIEEIVCKVNGDIITRSELEKDRKDAEAEFRSQGLTGRALQEAVDNASRNVLRGRIDRLLLIQKGKELDLKVDAEVTKKLADAQRRSGIADPEKFQQFVRQQTGMSFEDYKAELKNQAYVDRVIRQEVSSKLEFKREDLEKYYNEHKDEFQRQERVFLEKLYISTEGKDSGGVLLAERKAKDLVARARKGEKFEDLVQANSDDADAATGGEMPPMQKGELAKQIEDALWNQPRGYVSDPFKLDHPAGFYIFKVVEHQKAGLANFEEVRLEVENKLAAPKFDPLLRDYLTKLRQQAFLEIKQGYEDSGAAPGKNTAWSDPTALKPETVTKEEVAAKTVKKKLLWVIPVPGTSTKVQGTSSSH